MNSDDILRTAARRRRLPTPLVRRRIREEAGLRQCDVAAVLGVTREAVANYEKDRTPRDSQIVMAYGELLDRLVKSLAEDGIRGSCVIVSQSGLDTGGGALG